MEMTLESCGTEAAFDLPPPEPKPPDVVPPPPNKLPPAFVLPVEPKPVLAVCPKPVSSSESVLTFLCLGLRGFARALLSVG